MSGNVVWVGGLPSWSLPIFENGDKTGLTPEDVEQAEGWREEQWGERRFILSYGEEEYFSHRPLFGLPCLCVNVALIQE